MILALYSVLHIYSDNGVQNACHENHHNRLLTTTYLYLFRYKVSFEDGYVEDDGNKLWMSTSAQTMPRVCASVTVLFSGW